MSQLRTLIISLLMLCGAFFLAVGLAVPIPHLAWQAVPARDLPIGVILVFAGIALSRFWIVTRKEDAIIDDWKRARHHRK